MTNLNNIKKSLITIMAEIFAAGVNFCCVYLAHRKIFYMGQDGEYYLERY